MAKTSPDFSKAQERAVTSTAAEEILQRQEKTKAVVDLDKITDRPTGDTRKLKPRHIDALAESIAVLGLITPLTVDRHYRLLAGGHRRAALQKLAAENPDRYAELFPEGIPVHVCDIDAEVNTIDALQIEVEENTQRRNYTNEEIVAAAQKLKEVGYETLTGRPSKGQKSLNRELMSVFRLSRRRITNILNESSPAKKSEHQCALFSKIEQYQKQTKSFLDSLIANPPEKENQAKLGELSKNLQVQLQEVCALLEKYQIEEMEPAPLETKT